MKNANASEILKFFSEHYTRKRTPWNWIVEKKNAIRPIIIDESMAAFEKTKKIDKPAYYTVTSYEQLSRFNIAGTDYTEPNAVRQYINDFNVDLPIFGYRSVLDRKPDYLKPVLKEFKDAYIKINDSTTEQDLLVQRTILDSDIYYTYCIEKWIERHVAISTKDTFYHRFSVHTVNNRHPEFSYDFPIAGHADDMPYAFRGTLFYNPKTVWEKKDSDKDHALAFKIMNVMQKLFTNFIKHGKPVHNGDPMPESRGQTPMNPV
ncbi:uncharacterized protein LOC116344281 [Contarinia nasturtii]|uniref:uncharacterized protein LOC116344281 n=1 Tax=Contarinia nasturtii TaxID=265458 RepID=UPI0012D3B409|nr:uncharacterized protein LOC116344281 [Contarinia nasturtii]